MAQRVAARLWPDGQAVRLLAYFYLRHGTVVRIDAVDHIVEAARQPQILAVGADVAHVGAAAARNRPLRNHFFGGEIDHADAALALALAVDAVRAAVSDIQLLAVAARVQAMRAHARLDEADFLEGGAIDDVHAIGVHVVDKEFLAIGRDAYVVRHALLDAADFIGRATHGAGLGETFIWHLQFQIAIDLAVHHIDLGDGAVEFAGKDGVAAIVREIGVVDAAALRRINGILHGHGLRIPEVQAMARFGYHDGRLAIRRVIHIIRIVDRHFLARLARQRVDRRQTALVGALGVIRHPQSA